MPREGSFPEMTLEERALRHADEFFSGPEKWHKGGCQNVDGTAMCVGAALGETTPDKLYDWVWFGEILGLSSLDAPTWNDRQSTDFAALKAKLAERILFYTQKRLANSYIVVIGPGRQVKL